LKAGRHIVKGAGAKLLWFIGLWAGSVATVALLAWVIRQFIA
jgi:hypothetical protein